MAKLPDIQESARCPRITQDSLTKEWLLWRTSYGIISTHKTRKEAEAALAAELARS
jgi:hypothetical protein